ncbi:11315_t:CDS:2 [Scutellospora calospora]|uniref:11315_t:CDS:1 n=1 Tax=Scutellospora calospora TaxID=85575 RepID=A0ACA9K0S1_9GLOM|nr:11315_t:CDS:2 [Scutellospora calospora]
MLNLSLLPNEIFIMICEDHLYDESFTLFNFIMTNKENSKLVIPILYKYMKHNLKTVKHYLKLLYKELSKDDQNYIDMYVTEREYESSDDQVKIKKLVWDKGDNMFCYSSMIKLINAYQIFQYLFEDIHGTGIFMNLLINSNEKDLITGHYGSSIICDFNSNIFIKYYFDRDFSVEIKIANDIKYMYDEWEKLDKKEKTIFLPQVLVLIEIKKKYNDEITSFSKWTKKCVENPYGSKRKRNH